MSGAPTSPDGQTLSHADLDRKPASCADVIERAEEHVVAAPGIVVFAQVVHRAIDLRDAIDELPPSLHVGRQHAAFVGAGRRHGRREDALSQVPKALGSNLRRQHLSTFAPHFSGPARLARLPLGGPSGTGTSPDGCGCSPGGGVGHNAGRQTRSGIELPPKFGPQFLADAFEEPKGFRSLGFRHDAGLRRYPAWTALSRTPAARITASSVDRRGLPSRLNVR